MYWDGDKKIYIPAATEQANAEGAPSSAVDPDSPFAAPGKEKKDKPKNKTAQQVFTNIVFFFSWKLRKCSHGEHYVCITETVKTFVFSLPATL